MSTTYKLTYFDARGRAEISRLLFAAAGVEYEDQRIVWESEQWLEFKPKTPFGEIPILEVDGVTISQSLSIARLLAHRFQLAGHTDLERARADMLMDSYGDIINKVYPFLYYEEDKEKKAAATKKFLEEALPTFLDNLEKLLKENHSGDSFFVGDNLTWADLGFLWLNDLLKRMHGDDQIDKRPKLQALLPRIQNLPKIAEYLAKRPDTVD